MRKSVSLNAEFTLKIQVATGNFDSICLYAQKCVVPPCSSDGKESTCNVGDLGLIPELGRSNGEGKVCILYSLQYSGLENSMDCIVHGVAKSQTRLRNFHFHFHRYNRVTSLYT